MRSVVLLGLATLYLLDLANHLSGARIDIFLACQTFSLQWERRQMNKHDSEGNYDIRGMARNNGKEEN